MDIRSGGSIAERADPGRAQKGGSSQKAQKGAERRRKGQLRLLRVCGCLDTAGNPGGSEGVLGRSAVGLDGMAALIIG